jgi:hypothetical protein
MDKNIQQDPSIYDYCKGIQNPFPKGGAVQVYGKIVWP